MPSPARVSLSPECRLVFLTAGPAPAAERLAPLAREAGDWGRVVLMAERERAVGALWRVLKAVHSGGVPPAVVQHLHRSATVSTFRMGHLRDRLANTLAVLRDAGVPVLLLKGAALGASVYPAFESRPMSDVDILIRPGDAAAARTAVLSAGWRECTDPVTLRFLEGHHHLPAFEDAQGTGLRLEVHTSFLPSAHPFALTDADLWASSRATPEGFADARVPDSPHLLWHACVHFAWLHAMQFGAWRTFRDVAELLSQSLIDWDAFVSLAKQTRAASACYWTLRLARHLSELDVPDAVLRELEPPGSRLSKRAVERNFVAEIAVGEGPQCPSVTLSHVLWRMAIRPRWSGHATDERARKAARWGEALSGVPADSPAGRIVRHATGAGIWWRYVRRTLMAS